MSIKTITQIICDTCRKEIVPPNSEAKVFYEVSTAEIPRCFVPGSSAPAVFSISVSIGVNGGAEVQHICQDCVDGAFKVLAERGWAGGKSERGNLRMSEVYDAGSEETESE